MTGHLTVWYNTRCPICDAGIGWQRNKLLAAVRAGHLSFRDINDEPRHSRPMALRLTTCAAACMRRTNPAG
jgi:predicted DCC family thiol-disulfide oxidoreductase YuxK